MAAVADALVGELVSQLLSVVIEKKDRALKFKETLQKLESTLRRIGPIFKEIDGLNKKLDHPAEETDILIDQLKSGKKLVRDCGKVKWWKWCHKANYQEQLEALNESIETFFHMDLQAMMARNGLVTLDRVIEIHEVVTKLVPKKSSLRKVCLPPSPPASTFGLDDPLKDLKKTLLSEEVSVSVLTVTGTGGLGKSTLVQKCCWDEDVRGKFQENIFFLKFGKTPKLSTMVQRLFEHSGYEAPEFQDDQDAINQMENLFKEIGKSPILLVLDDVWPKTVSLVDNFVFPIPNYMILVTSRYAIARFGRPYVLQGLQEAPALELFRHEASLNKSTSRVPRNVVEEIVRLCSGSPLALRVVGRSLSNQPPDRWERRAKSLSKGRSILRDIDSSSEVLTCLQKSLDDLDVKATECFKDLGLFPEGQRIPATALVDIWALRGEDDATAMENIDHLADRSIAEILITRKVESGTIDYNYHYVTQHGLLRDLAILQTSQEPTSRLIIDLSANNLPSWWSIRDEYRVAAHTLSISTDETFTSEWCNLQPTEVEVLVLNLRQKKCTLPMFMKNMSKLKVLIVTNYDFYHADLENFEMIQYLSNVERIRLEKVSIPFLGNSGMQLKNLKKFSFFMCNVNEAFKNSSVQISDVVPNLEEINIDYCDMVELPPGISNNVSLKKLSITNCHNLSALPEGIGNLENLDTLRLTSCTRLAELPNSITSLHKLKFLDISDCISLSELPENLGLLRSLEKINCRGCSRLSELPYSITDLGNLRDVICDEERAALWEPFKTFLRDLNLEVVQVEFNLNWLL